MAKTARKPRKKRADKADESARKVRTPRSTINRAVAISHLGQGRSIRFSAEKAGVDEKTVRKWLKDPDFQAELKPLLEESIRMANQQIEGGLGEVAETALKIALGEVKGSPWQVAMIRDLLNRKKIGAGERVEVEGDMSKYSVEELQQIARGES